MDWRIGVAIGDQVLDLRRAKLIDMYQMNRLMQLTSEPRRALRQAISDGLAPRQRAGGDVRAALVPQSAVELGLPCEIGDYTDFYTSIHHATAVGKQFRPDNPLLPNYKWVPIGYHGRVSSIGVGHSGTGHTFRRPHGPAQAGRCRGAGARAEPAHGLRARTRRLRRPPQCARRAGTDRRGRGPGVRPRPLQRLERARHPAWEYQPLGPFLSKNFASTLSPVDRHARCAGTVPDRLSAAGERPGTAPLPRLGGQPRTRRLRHRARGLAADRGDARGRPRR
jgi:fumarylacetoacetase